MARKSAPKTGWYVYGVVDSDIDLEPGTVGIGEPPVPVELVRCRKIATLVSEVDLDRPIGRPEDLQAHQQILDAAVLETPVLPFRFGALLSSKEAVTTELLEPHWQEFDAALDALAGRAQYVVRARYHEEAVLREVLDQDPEAVRLARQIRESDEEVTRAQRIELGEAINTRVAARRDADTAALVEALADSTVEISARPPTDEFDAAHVALLVAMDRQRDCESAVRRLARDNGERMSFRMLGPMAAYDFVVTTDAGDDGDGSGV